MQWLLALGLQRQWYHSCIKRITHHSTFRAMSNYIGNSMYESSWPSLAYNLLWVICKPRWPVRIKWMTLDRYFSMPEKLNYCCSAESLFRREDPFISGAWENAMPLYPWTILCQGALYHSLTLVMGTLPQSWAGVRFRYLEILHSWAYLLHAREITGMHLFTWEKITGCNWRKGQNLFFSDTDDLL